VLAYSSAASPTWLLAQNLSWPELREGKPEKRIVERSEERYPSSRKAVAPIKAMPLAPALMLNPGIIGPESTSLPAAARPSTLDFRTSAEVPTIFLSGTNDSGGCEQWR